MSIYCRNKRERIIWGSRAAQYIPFAAGTLLDADKIFEKVLDHSAPLLRGNGVLDARHEAVQFARSLRRPDRFLDEAVSFRNQILLVFVLAAGTVGILSLLLISLLLTQIVDSGCLVDQSILQQSQFASVDIDLGAGHLEAMAVGTLRSK